MNAEEAVILERSDRIFCNKGVQCSTMGNNYYVYIITNFRNTVLYTGITNNLNRRIWEHKNKAVKGFTQKYNCNKLVYFETYDDVETAIAREKSIKNLVRRKKVGLIEKVNADWADLAE